MRKAILIYVILISCLSLLFVKVPFVKVCRAFEPVVVEFLYIETISVPIVRFGKSTMKLMNIMFR